MSLLRVENVSKQFGSLIAVNGVSMNVEPGELRAVIGPNGAGKTTFFNLISGFLTPTAGRVTFDNEDITHMLPARRVWKVSEMYLRKIRPRTTCLYSAASMLFRSLSAVSQSLASKPMVAED